MSEREEKKNKTIAFAVSAGIHASIFALFFLLMGWSAPYPPYPEYGIELNYGLDQQGGGDIQPEVPVGSEKAVENKQDESVPQPKEEVKETVKETKADEPLTSQDNESPVVVKEDKKEEKKKEKPTEQPTAKVEKKISFAFKKNLYLFLK